MNIIQRGLFLLLLVSIFDDSSSFLPLLALLVFFYGIYSSWENSKWFNWSKTLGTIKSYQISREIKDSRSISPIESWKASLKVYYSVAGREYFKEKRIGLPSALVFKNINRSSSVDKKDFQHIKYFDKYVTENYVYKKVTVFHHPRKPDSALVSPSFSVFQFIFPLGTIVLFLSYAVSVGLDFTNSLSFVILLIVIIEILHIFYLMKFRSVSYPKRCIRKPGNQAR